MVLMSISGFFAMVCVRGKLIVDGDATATANNLAAHESLFRLGIAGNSSVRPVLFSWC
jgi:hypothetical protein